MAIPAKTIDIPPKTQATGKPVNSNKIKQKNIPVASISLISINKPKP
jgi:hypothetical protein